MLLGRAGHAPGRNRTFNLRIKSPLLCQLSYRGARKTRPRRIAFGYSPDLGLSPLPSGFPPPDGDAVAEAVGAAVGTSGAAWAL